MNGGRAGRIRNACMKGQTSAEFLTLLLAGLIILVIVLAIAYDQFTALQLTKGAMEARNSVETLKSAASEVYGQGEGARRLVYIQIPPNYEPNTSFVANRTISLKVRGNDVASTTGFDVYGTLPGTEGGHFVWVISEGNRVRIGNIFLFVNKNSLLVQMLQTQSKSDNFTVQNIGTKPINVTITRNWLHSDVSAAVSETAFSLGPDETQEVTVTFESNASAAGDYTGSLDITGFDGTDEETFPLLLDAEILVPEVTANISNVSGVGVIGHIWYQAVPRNQSASRVFSICTLPNISISSMSFTGSGTAGGWLAPASGGPLPADSCYNQLLTLNVPADAALGNTTGSILISGDGFYNDTIILIINVLPLDTIPPVVLNITRTPRPVFVHQFLNITANGSDIGRGNSAIDMCQIKIDNGTVMNMMPSDGAYDTPNELAYMNFPPYSISAGNHTAFVRCIDHGGNVGAFSNITFVMHKEILFIFTDDPSGISDEGNWFVFVANPKSKYNFTWSYDADFATNVNHGSRDLNAYAVLVYADYEPDIGNDVTINRQNDAGRGTVLLGSAVDWGPTELGFGQGSGSMAGVSTTMYVMNNGHYITSFLPADTTVPIYRSSTNRFVIPTDCLGTQLVRDSSGGSSKIALDVYSNIVSWGALSPLDFTSNGTNISIRAIDWAINRSLPAMTD